MKLYHNFHNEHSKSQKPVGWPSQHGPSQGKYGKITACFTGSKIVKLSLSQDFVVAKQPRQHYGVHT